MGNNESSLANTQPGNYMNSSQVDKYDVIYHPNPGLIPPSLVRLPFVCTWLDPLAIVDTDVTTQFSLHNNLARAVLGFANLHPLYF